MNRLFCLFLISIFAGALSISSVSAQDGLFTLASDQPVVAHGKSGQWDGQYTDPGAVFYDDGMFHMFRNGFVGWPASVQIAYLTSPDGIHWTQPSPDPVMYSKDVPYAKVAALASDALVLADGTWVLYFYTWNSFDQNAAPGAIGRATAPAPSGPWTPDPAPILNPGPKGSWDDLRVNAPRVVKTDDGYRMYYAGFDENGLSSGQIGMATSTDGIHWTKYDDPSTTAAPYAESDPIMKQPKSLVALGQPMVEQTPDGWVMTFRQNDFNGGLPQMTLNDALSADGIHWNAAPQPFWERSTIPRSNGFWYTAMEYHDGTYYQYIETGIGGGTSIFLATHTGSLKPTS
ncbi:MAG TPA: hypothetical protein VHD90_27340 [Phototrophicaceae bacterium]|nr:hypothetical protein [Phototrophicaceae bacterium]